MIFLDRVNAVWCPVQKPPPEAIPALKTRCGPSCAARSARVLCPAPPRTVPPRPASPCSAPLCLAPPRPAPPPRPARWMSGFWIRQVQKNLRQVKLFFIYLVSHRKLELMCRISLSFCYSYLKTKGFIFIVIYFRLRFDFLNVFDRSLFFVYLAFFLFLWPWDGSRF